ncbi:hypothetical protein J2Z62_000467 [Mycoplasmoides fastidiosum]|uniref:Uncharacterized protein n=1 Tax=Mycoplasmoides fastidiosum TaxID=92758 RepID=A0ABU0LZ93_9BACT|nr:hypothetical protein [Mycoplasmoides fastidiosum]MDQ0514029.1 hypothetical protein [Mycoplasmoides fastidiosum]UUD37561.1 hypothetical protein NPA10_03270 [Mycoplasmoides fastidiosum]
MKSPHLNYAKILSLKKAVIINDDARLNKRFFEQIIDLALQKDPSQTIIYFPAESCVKAGHKLDVIWTNFLELIHSDLCQQNNVLFLMDGLEYFSKKQYNFSFSDNITFYGICSNFLHWENRNLFLQLIPKFYCEYKLNLSYLLTQNQNKWNDYNQLIYHYCLNLYEAHNLVKMEEDWNIIIENLISQKIGFLANKKISSNLLRTIIRKIATTSFGAFSIGKFCDENDLRYESVMLALNFLIEIKLVTEIRYILNNDFHSKKRQSMYFLNHNFLYFYFCHYSQINIPVENIVLSQVIKDFNQFNQHAPNSCSYQTGKSDNEAILNFKIGILSFQVDLNQENYAKIQLTDNLMQKIYNIEHHEFQFMPINRKQFFSQKKINIISAVNSAKNNINLFDYLSKINF